MVSSPAKVTPGSPLGETKVEGASRRPNGTAESASGKQQASFGKSESESSVSQILDRAPKASNEGSSALVSSKSLGDTSIRASDADTSLPSAKSFDSGNFASASGMSSTSSGNLSGLSKVINAFASSAGASTSASEGFHPLMQPPLSAPPTAGAMIDIAYPSPSGGFVPPPNDEDGAAWKLQPAPAGANSRRKQAVEGVVADAESLGTKAEGASPVSAGALADVDTADEQGELEDLSAKPPMEFMDVPPSSSTRMSMPIPLPSSSTSNNSGNSISIVSSFPRRRSGADAVSPSSPSASRSASRSLDPNSSLKQPPQRPQSIPSSQETASRIARSRSGSRRGSQSNSASASAASSALDHTSGSRPPSGRSDPSSRKRLARRSGLPDLMQEGADYDAENVQDSGRASSASPQGTRSAIQALESDTRLKGKGKASSVAFSASPDQSTAFSLRSSNTGGTGALLGGEDSFALGTEQSQATLDPEAEAEALRKWQEELAILYAQLKVRDFAFPETDPRHLGARDVSADADAAWDPQGADYGYGAGGNAEGAEDENLDEEFDVEDGEGGLSLGLYEVLYAFQAESEHELSVEAGEKVRVVGALDGGWAIVELVSNEETANAEESPDESNIKKGLVPESYLGWIGD